MGRAALGTRCRSTFLRNQEVSAGRLRSSRSRRSRSNSRRAEASSRTRGHTRSALPRTMGPECTRATFPLDTRDRSRSTGPLHSTVRCNKVAAWEERSCPRSCRRDRHRYRLVPPPHNTPARNTRPSRSRRCPFPRLRCPCRRRRTRSTSNTSREAQCANPSQFDSCCMPKCKMDAAMLLRVTPRCSRSSRASRHHPTALPDRKRQPRRRARSGARSRPASRSSATHRGR